MPEKNKHLEQENAELKAQVKALSTLNPALYTGVNDDSDEIDLAELWNAIWAGKWLIIAITFVFSVGSVLYALNLPDEYKSTVLLAPASSSSSSSLSKLAGQFGGLASLAGINLGGGGAEDKTVVAMEIMKTWGFLETFIIDNNIQVEVFAAEGWNRSSNTLIIDPELYDVDSKQWVRDDFSPSKGQTVVPSSWELYGEFKGRVSVNQDKASGLIRLSVEYFSPIIAKEWTGKLVKAINAHIQKQDREEAIKSIEYLNEKINETNVADMQAVFYQLIEEQTKTLMLAEVSDEYVFKTLSRAKISEEKTKPKRALVTILGSLLGLIMSTIFVLIRHF
ncbi:MAG: LPS O-antigen length regulator [Kangiella sp.]|nr:MAG: LPS O-antigen length regulator [Kangiella sp.]PHS19875.1 MAG: LPS O-antigen length regulator [Kangiella sp.]